MRGQARTKEERQQRLVIRCECGRDGCREELIVLRGEYEAARLSPALFLVAVGHGVEEVERPFYRGDRCEIVQLLEQLVAAAST